MPSPAMLLWSAFFSCLLLACGQGGTPSSPRDAASTLPGADASMGSGGGGSGTGSAAGDPTTDTSDAYGEVHEGQYHLGPVDFAESAFHNACAPAGGYRSELRSSVGLDGEFLAGVSNELSEGGGLCDACLLIRTATGRSIVARIVTYGVEQAPGDIDVSPSVYAALNMDEYPRSMSWQLAKCPELGGLQYEFQAGANEWWTSLWVRNARVPIDRVEVMSQNHTSYVELRRGSDGTLTDDSGFGAGPFTLRISGVDGQVITDTFPGFTPGQLIPSTQQFE